MKRRLGDVLFIWIICLLMVFFYYGYGLKGFAIVLWILFLPLYLLRLLVWSFWLGLRQWLSVKFTPKSYVILVFCIWGSLSVLLWLYIPNILSSVGKFPLPTWVRIVGFILAAWGLILSFWAQWLIGFKTAILITRIFNKWTIKNQRVIKTGPYALFPHPIFIGEWLIIFGCLLLTLETALLYLLLAAFLVDIFAARGEEKDLKERFGKEYQDYRSQILLLIKRKGKG
ncbi:MAG: methyltransferase [bacterium]